MKKLMTLVLVPQASPPAAGKL